MNEPALSHERRQAALRHALGDDILGALLDPTVLEVLVNPDGRLILDRAGEGREDMGVTMTAASRDRAIRLVADFAGETVGRDDPRLSGVLPGGERFQAGDVVPAIVAIGMARELGPVLGGLMVAARVASSIAAEIGISKRTLYNHFPSKDALIEAYLQRRFVQPRPSDKPPAEQILATFDSLERRFAAKDFRGCPFVNAVAELGPDDEDHTVRDIAVAFKESRRVWFRDLLQQLRRGIHQQPVPLLQGHGQGGLTARTEMRITGPRRRSNGATTSATMACSSPSSETCFRPRSSATSAGRSAGMTISAAP